MKGLRANRIGANPMLHLAAHEVALDPEVRTMLQSFRDAREFQDLTAIESFLGLFASASADLPKNGPMAALAQRLQRIGWEVSPQGIIHDQFGQFSVLQINILARRSVASSP